MGEGVLGALGTGTSVVPVLQVLADLCPLSQVTMSRDLFSDAVWVFWGLPDLKYSFSSPGSFKVALKIVSMGTEILETSTLLPKL